MDDIVQLICSGRVRGTVLQHELRVKEALEELGAWAELLCKVGANHIG